MLSLFVDEILCLFFASYSFQVPRDTGHQQVLAKRSYPLMDEPRRERRLRTAAAVTTSILMTRIMPQRPAFGFVAASAVRLGFDSFVCAQAQ